MQDTRLHLEISSTTVWSSKVASRRSRLAVTRNLHVSSTDGEHHAICQVQAEDNHDACKALWPNFDHFHEYDHSCVHSKKKVDGLDVAAMNADFGGARTIKRDSVITEGCLGPFDPKLKVFRTFFNYIFLDASRHMLHSLRSSGWRHSGATRPLSTTRLARSWTW